jgi:hypothetical protein
LSTSQDKRLRNGELAVNVILEDIAEHKREAYKDDTLMAAYAESGDFGSAVIEKVYKKAINE